MDAVWPYLAAILPTILVAILFYFLIKSMLEGDRRERIAQRRFEAEQDRERDLRAENATDSEGRDGAPHGRVEGPDDGPENAPG
jgi:bacterioferritin (cytochrome b1)